VPILDRYIMREVFRTWLGVTAILLFVLVTNQFARVLGKAASGELPKDAVFALLGLTSVQYVSVLIPVAVLIAIMLALGRFNRDSELTAIYACGVGNARILRPLLLFAALLAVLLAWLTLVVVPQSLLATAQIQADASKLIDRGGLEPGRFHTENTGGAVVFVERVDDQGMLRNLFLQRRTEQRVEAAVARRGRITENQDSGLRTMLLYDGERYEGVPGSVNFQVIRFAEHGIPVRVKSGKVNTDLPKLMPTSQLIGSAEPSHKAELQWRLSSPLSLFALTLIAVPLCRASPREGRYGRIALGILIYVLYSNLTEATRSWVERELFPSKIGIYWVPVSIVAVAAVMLWWQERSRRQPRREGTR
jgi:lipopolysaccharide export system permease protein